MRIAARWSALQTFAVGSQRSLASLQQSCDMPSFLFSLP